MSQIQTKQPRAGGLASRWLGALAASGLLAFISGSSAQVAVQTVGGGVRVECGSSSGFVAGNTWTNAQFNQPYAAAMDTQGNMWIADLGNSDIELVTDAGNRASSQTYQVYFGSNKHPYTNVIGVALDSADDLYVLTTSTLIEYYNVAASFPDLVPVLEIPLSAFSSSPATSIAVVNDAATNIYISFASSSSGKIIRIPQPYAGPGSVANVVNNYSFAPSGLSMRVDGQLAVSDTLNDGIYVVATNNGSTPLLVTGGYGPGFANGPPTVLFNGKIEPVAYFNSPHGIVASSDGRMAVCDTGNSLVRLIDTNYNTSTIYGTLSNVWTTTCCTCSPTRYAGWVDGSPGINSTNASGREPVGVALSTNGTLFVTEVYYSLIRAATGTGLLPVTAINSSGGGGVSTNPPTLTGETVSSVGTISATLNVNVDPNGSTTTVYFDYGANTNALSTTTPFVISNAADLNITNSVSIPVTGLPPNTVIYYEAVAYNSFGYTYGTNLLFHTTAVGPSATTLPATNISSIGATLNGTVNPNGASTSFYFEYGLTTNYGSFTPTNVFATNFYTNQPVSDVINGLAAGTTNHFQLVAFDGAGTNYGGDLSFVTPVLPPTVSISPSFGYFPECQTITVTSSVPNVYYTEDGSTPTTNSAAVALTPVNGNYVGTFQWCNPQIDLSQLQMIAVNAGVSTPLAGSSSTTNILGFVRSPAIGIGATAFIPIVLDLRSNATIETLQFLVEVTPSNGAPAIAPISMLPITSNDFVQVVAPGSSQVTLSTVPETNSFSTSGQALLVYTQGLNTGLDVQNYGVIGLLQVQIPVNAAVNNQYTLSVLYPSGTAAGGQIGVPLGAMVSQSLVVSNLPYLVGDSAPAYGYDSEEFGDGILDNRDVNNAIFASLGARVPPINSDAYNAMDAYPPPTGDGVINFSDWNLILMRSESLDLPNWIRTWAVNGNLVGMADTTNNAGLPGNPAVPTDAAEPQGPPPGQVWYTQASITSSTVTYAQPGSICSVPIYANVSPGCSLSGIQFRAVVTPSDGAPPAGQASIKLSGNVPTPEFNMSSLVPGDNDISVGWIWGSWGSDNIPLLQNSSNYIGSVNFQIPANAQLGQCYAVHFAGVSGGLDDTTDYSMESWPGYVWVQSPALQPASITSDEWKTHFFGNYTNSMAADNVDADGDGMLNWQEYLAGTDPTNPQSALQFDNTGLSTNGVSGVALSWLTAPGKTYVLQSIPALRGGNWTAINTNTGDGYNYQFIETKYNSGAQFYRILVQP